MEHSRSRTPAAPVERIQRVDHCISSLHTILLGPLRCRFQTLKLQPETSVRRRRRLRARRPESQGDRRPASRSGPTGRRAATAARRAPAPSSSRVPPAANCQHQRDAEALMDGGGGAEGPRECRRSADGELGQQQAAQRPHQIADHEHPEAGPYQRRPNAIPTARFRPPGQHPVREDWSRIRTASTLNPRQRIQSGGGWPNRLIHPSAPVSAGSVISAQRMPCLRMHCR